MILFFFGNYCLIERKEDKKSVTLYGIEKLLYDDNILFRLELSSLIVVYDYFDIKYCKIKYNIKF